MEFMEEFLVLPGWQIAGMVIIVAIATVIMVVEARQKNRQQLIHQLMLARRFSEVEDIRIRFANRHGRLDQREEWKLAELTSAHLGSGQIKAGSIDILLFAEKNIQRTEIRDWFLSEVGKLAKNPHEIVDLLTGMRKGADNQLLTNLLAAMKNVGKEETISLICRLREIKVLTGSYWSLAAIGTVEGLADLETAEEIIMTLPPNVRGLSLNQFLNNNPDLLIPESQLVKMADQILPGIEERVDKTQTRLKKVRQKHNLN